MFTSPSDRPSNPPQRPAARGWLGGVCARLSVDPGWVGVGPLRVMFVIAGVLVTVPALFLYVALWIALARHRQWEGRTRRPRREAPMPKVSWSMRRRLRKLGDQVDAVKSAHDERVALLVMETFDAIKLLAPRLQRPKTVRDERLAEAALVRFPALIDKMLGMSPDDLADGAARSDRTRRTPAGVLVDRLVELHDGFAREATLDVEAAAGLIAVADEAGRETRTLHDRIRPLALRLGQSSAAASVATLESVVAKLEFLLGRIEGGADGMDLRPFKVRRIAFEFLPHALEHFLQLPPELAGRHRIAGGRTAAQSLQEQLELLDARLGDLTRSYYEKDATGLLVHGRFLRDTFGEGGLQLDAPPQAPLPPHPTAASASLAAEPSWNGFGHGARPPVDGHTAPGPSGPAPVVPRSEPVGPTA
jgi:hypothetical protein